MQISTMLNELKDLYNKASDIEKYYFADILNNFLLNQTEEIIMQQIPYFGLMSDKLIIQAVKDSNLIENFIPEKIQATYSYGLEPMGYTARFSGEYVNLNTGKKEVGELIFGKDPVIVSTLEKFNFPKSICGFIYNKSSFLRQGVIGSFASIEPGYSGYLTLLFFNVGNNSVKMIPGQGIAQIHFIRPASSPDSLYEGKYKNDNSVNVFSGK